MAQAQHLADVVRERLLPVGVAQVGLDLGRDGGSLWVGVSQSFRKPAYASALMGARRGDVCFFMGCFGTLRCGARTGPAIGVHPSKATGVPRRQTRAAPAARLT